MIIYCIFANRGGLTRVAEDLIAMLPAIPKEIPFQLVVLSQEVHESSDPRLHWIKLDGEFTLLPEQIKDMEGKIARQVDLRGVKWLIGEEMVLPFWEKWLFPILYDVHLLQRAFFEEFLRSPGIEELDVLFDPPPNVMLRASMLKIFKHETKWMRRATGFIANSQNSVAYLQRLYSAETSGRPIYHIPVHSALSEGLELGEGGCVFPLYYFGRFHPQKGVHFVFGQDWNDLPLFMRGSRDLVLTNLMRSKARDRGIILLPWSFDHNLLAREIAGARNILFPSIYEPWGLSLEESMARGKFCIANATSGHNEQITHGETGWLVDMSKQGWKESVQEANRLPEKERQRICQAARVVVRERSGERQKTFLNFLRQLN